MIHGLGELVRRPLHLEGERELGVVVGLGRAEAGIGPNEYRLVVGLTVDGEPHGVRARRDDRSRRGAFIVHDPFDLVRRRVAEVPDETIEAGTRRHEGVRGRKASVSSASGREPRGFSARVSRGCALAAESALALSRGGTGRGEGANHLSGRVAEVEGDWRRLRGARASSSPLGSKAGSRRPPRCGGCRRRSVQPPRERRGALPTSGRRRPAA